MLHLIVSKVGRVFPIVVVSILPHAEFGPNDLRKDAPHFTRIKRTSIADNGPHQENWNFSFKSLVKIVQGRSDRFCVYSEALIGCASFSWLPIREPINVSIFVEWEWRNVCLFILWCCQIRSLVNRNNEINTAFHLNLGYPRMYHNY